MKVGQKITCINGDVHPSIRNFYKGFPVTGKVYTVREIRPENAEGGFLLVEIVNKPVYLSHYKGWVEPAFSKDRFRLCGEENIEDDRVEIAIRRHQTIKSN